MGAASSTDEGSGVDGSAAGTTQEAPAPAGGVDGSAAGTTQEVPAPAGEEAAKPAAEEADVERQRGPDQEEHAEEGLFAAFVAGTRDAFDEIRDVVGLGSGSQTQTQVLQDVDAQTWTDVKELYLRMPLKMRENSCAKEQNGQYVWRPIVGTRLSELGEYGVGIQLYFELLKAMGILYLVLFAITFPTLVMNLIGDHVAQNPVTKDLQGSVLARFTIANLGYCEGGECTFRNSGDRLLCQGCTTMLKDATFWMALLDGIATFVFLLFAVFFLHWWIPKRVTQHDAKHDTGSDFAVDVSHLPRFLGADPQSAEHQRYAEELEEHFKDVIKLRHPNIEEEHQEAPGDPTRPRRLIHEVSLIREYDGFVREAIRVGYLKKLEKNAEDNIRIATHHGDKEKVAKYEKQVARTKKQIQEIDTSMGKQGDMKDVDREICGAIVMFKDEKLKDIVLAAYANHNTTLARLNQPRELQFMKQHPIKVDQACEPLDLYWENLDYHKARRMMRQCLIVVLSILIIVFCTVVLVNLRSYKALQITTRDPSRFYVLGALPDAPEPCVDLCMLALYEDAGCRRALLPTIHATSTGLDTDIELFKTSPAGHLGGDRCAVQDLYGRPNAAGTCFPYIVFGFQKPKKVDCLQVLARDGLNRTRVAAMYSCPGWNTSAPDLLTQCIRLRNIADIDVDPPIQDSLVEFDKSCAQEVTFTEARAAKQHAARHGEDPASNPVVGCYCEQQELMDPLLIMRNAGASEAAEVCEEWSDKRHGTLWKTVASISAVCILNLLLNFLFSYLDEWTRHRTLTSLTMSSMNKLFWALYVNTGLIFVLVSADFHGFLNFRFLEVIRLDQLGKGPFSDLTGAWYVTSGIDFLLTTASNVLVFTATPLIMSFVVNPFMIRFYRRGLVTESILCEVYVLPEWPLSLRLAQTVCIFMCVAMYSGGMPVLYLVGAAYCLVSYWADKVCLLRGSKLPPAYNADLVAHAVDWVFFSGFVHVGITSWMFGLQEIFPSEFSGLKGLFEWIFSMDGRTYDQIMLEWLVGYTPLGYPKFGEYVHARMLDMSRKGCVVVALMLLGFVLYWLCYALWYLVLTNFPCRARLSRKFAEYEEKVARTVSRNLGDGGHEQPNETDEDAEPVASQLNSPGASVARLTSEHTQNMRKQKHKLFSYKMGNNPRYEEAYKAILFLEEND